MLDFTVLMVFPAAMAFAAATDLLTMTIPNRISVALIAGFALAVLVAGLAPYAVLMHIATGAFVLLAGFLLFAFGFLGGGDAKLLAAAALWVGPEALLPFLVVVTILGGGLAPLILAYRRLPMPALPDQEWSVRLHEREEGVPYGIAIAGGRPVGLPGNSHVPGLGWLNACVHSTLLFKLLMAAPAWDKGEGPLISY